MLETKEKKKHNCKTFMDTTYYRRTFQRTTLTTLLVNQASLSQCSQVRWNVTKFAKARELTYNQFI